MKRSIGALLLALVLSLCGCLAPSTMDAPAQTVHTVTLEYRVKENGAVEIASTLQTQQQTQQQDDLDCLFSPPLDFSQKVARFTLLNVDTQALPPVEEMAPDALEAIIASGGGGGCFTCKQTDAVLEGCWIRLGDSVERFNFRFQLVGDASQTFTQVYDETLAQSPFVVEITEIELWMSEALQAAKIPEVHITQMTIGDFLDSFEALTRHARACGATSLPPFEMRLEGTKAVFIFADASTSKQVRVTGEPLTFEMLNAALPQPLTYSYGDFMTAKALFEQLSPLIKPVTITIKTLPTAKRKNN